MRLRAVLEDDRLSGVGYDCFSPPWIGPTLAWSLKVYSSLPESRPAT